MTFYHNGGIYSLLSALVSKGVKKYIKLKSKKKKKEFIKIGHIMLQ